MEHNQIYYVVFFEGNMFQTFKDIFSKKKRINKEGPFAYNSVKQSFLQDPRHNNYAVDSIHHLITWAKQNIPHIKRRSFNSFTSLQPIPEDAVLQVLPEEPALLEPALSEPALLVLPEEPALSEPALPDIENTATVICDE
jgi:hypothetical protein